MAGRAKRAPAKSKRPEAPPLDAHEPRGYHLTGHTDHAPALAARAEIAVQDVPRRIDLSSSYRAALAAEIPIEDAKDLDAVQDHILLGVRGARGHKGLCVADLVASSLVLRAIRPESRDGVLAARELADRTEGPVTQRIESASVRYVVSVGPSGALGPASQAALPAPEWERMARLDWESAQAQPSLSATPEDEMHRANRG